MTTTPNDVPPTPSQSKPSNGLIKVGFYEVLSTIGKGNHAVVKLARHRITKTEVAIKVMDKRRLDADSLKKVYREIEVLKKIRHKHVIKLYQVMESTNMIYLVSEYAKNGEIYDYVARRRKLNEDEAREKFWQIVSAVDYLHANGIVHRDLKAENLLLDANNQVKLIDFGFSNFYGVESLNTFCGSPPYASPEIFAGKLYNGPEVDIWSMGIVLYVMICGVLPFEGSNLQSLRDRVLSGFVRFPYFMSTDCENLIRKMLALDPAKRLTIEQIKKHKWMRAEQMEPKLHPSVRLYGENEPQPRVLRLMQTLGVEPSRVKTSLMNEAYDNFHGIYSLLLEQLRVPSNASPVVYPPPVQPSNSTSSSGIETSASHAVSIVASPTTNPEVSESKNRRRQSDPRSRPLLNALLRNHSAFQTTDCITTNFTPTTSNSPISYEHFNYDEKNPTLSRQSTVGTIGSIDEGVESDTSSQSRTAFSSESGNSLLLAGSSPFSSFDSQGETDIMSDSSSVCCPPDNPQDETLKNPQHEFGESWRASDNSMLNSLSTAFPVGKLATKTRVVPQTNRFFTGAMSAQMKRLRLTLPSANQAPAITGKSSKRISLPENLKLQPQVLLNLKQSIYVEKQLGGENLKTAEPKQMLKLRLAQQQQQKRLAKARLQLFRQGSYQLAQKQSIMSTNMTQLHLHEDPVCTLLSPIEDFKSEEMDAN